LSICHELVALGRRSLDSANAASSAEARWGELSSCGVRDLDVIVVGPVAPPLGGIAAHVERLTDVLEREGLRVAVVDHFGNRKHARVIATLRRNPLRYWWHMRRLRARVVHYHYARWSTLVAA